MIPLAYRVMPYAVTGPQWMTSARWDILAKMPQGASKDQVPEMLQALLAERFKLTFHRESREQNGYALVAAKDGAKLKASDVATGVPTTGRDVLITAQGQLQQGADGSMVVSGGALGPVRVTMPDARDNLMHLAMNVSMAHLTELLSSLVDKPVVDMTELRGDFAVSLALPDDVAKGVMRFAAGVGMLPAGNGAPESIFDAVKKLGLRLEGRKLPMDMIVVDHVEKTPTEN